MEDKITKQKLETYFKTTEEALEKVKKKIFKRKKREAKEIIEMTENYLSDAKFFKEKGDFVNAFAALNYSHGWIDSGVRIGIFDVKDRNLFTIK